ncbi:LytTR family DNA-binding domain-containing protein [Altererythrobacter litoralis]|uniref:LytTR family DNA-binding domain-containing protein n=1 Tax=Altererythrobacter litoralis TaxID=3113904 RepID=A0ABU7GGE5_9SPHN|nr:LytTR family DNA-binding domain-containing protein [Erythrobacteraceae bacterium 1XM1-14]
MGFKQIAKNCLATTTLQKLLEALPWKDFVQVHRSFIVRRDRIFEQRRASLSLDNGIEVTIGRSCRKNEII